MLDNFPIDYIFNHILRHKSDKDEWIYESKMLKQNISTYRKTGVPPELSDYTELRYFDKLIKQTKEMLSVGSIKGWECAEFGSGTGLTSMYMCKEGANVTLVDTIAESMEYSKCLYEYLSKTNKMGDVNYVVGNILKENNKLKKYDLVHNIGVIEHFDDKFAENVLKMMCKATKKGGYVAVGVPNFFSPDLINIWRKYGKGSERFYSNNKLLQAMKNVGLINIKTSCSRFVFPTFVDKGNSKFKSALEDFLGEKFHLGFLVMGIGKKI